MKFVVVAEGKIKDRHLRALCDDYLGRIRKVTRCDEIEVKSAGALERALPAEARLVALDVKGEQVTSAELAKRIERWVAQGKGEVAFVIGGAEGVPKAVVERCGTRLSLSSLTLPHRLARVVLLEQLYRSITLIRGEPYARED